MSLMDFMSILHVVVLHKNIREKKMEELEEIKGKGKTWEERM